MRAKLKRDSSGKFLPKWAGEMRENQTGLAKTMLQISKAIGPEWEDGNIRVGPPSLQEQIWAIRERVGSIGWQWAINLAGFAAIGYLGLKVYGYAPY